MSLRPGVALVALLALLVTGCGTPADGRRGPETGGVTLDIAAAASLKTAIDRLTEAYAAVDPSIAFTVAAGSSAALRTQIEQGASFDVFLAADTRNPQALVDAGLAAGPPTVFAANGIALVVPADGPGRIGAAADLARPGLRLIAAGEDVPITGYAEAVLDALARMQAAPEAWLRAVQANIASREDDVAAVLARIELGEGDAGFVYATDAARADRVRSIPIPDQAAVRATYAGVVPHTGAHPAEGSAFLAWLAGPRGQEVLRPLGFLAP